MHDCFNSLGDAAANILADVAAQRRRMRLGGGPVGNGGHASGETSVFAEPALWLTGGFSVAISKAVVVYRQSDGSPLLAEPTANIHYRHPFSVQLLCFLVPSDSHDSTDEIACARL